MTEKTINPMVKFALEFGPVLELLPLTSEGWMILTKRLTGAFAALAVANEVVWRTMSTDAWVKIETFGFPVALFAFFMLQTNLFTKYSSEEQDEA